MSACRWTNRCQNLTTVTFGRSDGNESGCWLRKAALIYWDKLRLEAAAEPMSLASNTSLLLWPLPTLAFPLPGFESDNHTLWLLVHGQQTDRQVAQAVEGRISTSWLA